MFDLVITNATVVDGTGAPAHRATLSITEGKIVDVDERTVAVAANARELVDADGDVIAPGFIDLHSHADFSVQGSPAAQTQLAQGVTTVVTGNCGASTFPARDLNLLRQASAQFDAVFDGSWHDAHGFREVTDLHRPGVNLVLQLGHTTLRAHVLGMANRPATESELRQMAREIRLAADQGVRGFTSGLVYAPGSFADAREMRVLVAAAADAGLLYSSHLRNESDRLLKAVDEAVDAADHGGARLQISHLKAMGPASWGMPARALERIETALVRGIDVAADVYPYTASSTTLTSRLPPNALDGGLSALAARLADGDERAQIAAGFAARFGHDVDPAGVVVAAVGPKDPNVAEDLGWSAGLSLVELGEKLGVAPEEAAMRVLAAHAGAVAIVNHAMSEDDMTSVLRHPLVSVASDGWTLSLRGTGMPHPRSFGTFARVLGTYVREQRVLSLEEAVRKMTSLPASRIGLTDRGVIKPGYTADLVRFDPHAIADRATYAQPRQLAVGVKDVWLAGRRALRNEEITGERHGRIL